MIFDSHAHLGKRNFARVSGENLPIFNNAAENTWPAFARLAEANGVFKAAVFPFPFPTVNARRANEYVIEAGRRRADLFLPLLLVSDEASFIENHLGEIVGGKEEFYLPGGRDLKAFLPVYDLLQEADKVLLIHPHWEDRISRVKYIRRNFPKLRMILAHSGRKWPFTGDDVLESIIPELRSVPDLFFDTSTIRVPEVISQIVQSVGASRVIFGSDYPFYKKKGEDTFRLELAAVNSAGLSDTDLECVLRGTFKTLFLQDRWIRRARQEDASVLFGILDSILPVERKHLAIDKKLDIFRANLRAERHILVLEDPSGILGFLRESGRPDGGAMVEELCVSPVQRGHGYGKVLLGIAQRMFTRLEAKTFARNTTMNCLLERMGFAVPENQAGKSILLWEWKNGA